MRSLVTITGLTLLAVLAGCSNTRFGFLNRERDRPVTGPPPAKEEIVAYLNDNASRIHSFRTDDLHITVHQGLVPIGLSGKMMTQKPRDFRMSGDALGNRVVDLGSNSQEFWWWISKDNPPDQYYCSYKDLEDGRVRALPFPIQPEWIMETIGLGPYGPVTKYEMEHDDYTLKLVERTKSPQGRPLRKVIVMKRAAQRAPNPQVVEYLLLDDSTGKELCSAQISQVQIDRASGAILPRNIDLRCAVGQEKVRLELRFDNIAVNAQLPPTAFVRQTMPGVRSVDLARAFGNAGVQPTQAILNP